MAVEVEAAGQVDEFVRVLRRRIWWIIIPVAVIGSLGTFFAVVVPKKYVVTTKVLVRDTDEKTGELGQNASAIEGAVAKINITSAARIDSVLSKAKWKDDDYWSLSLPERNEYRDKLLKDLRVSTPTMARDADQQLVEITFQHTNAVKAVDFLTRLKDDWIDDVLLRHLTRARTDLRETTDKLEDLVKDRMTVVEDLRSTRTEYKIPPPTQTDFLRVDARMASFGLQDRLTTEVADLEMEISELRLAIERDQLIWASMDRFEEPVAVGPSSSVDKRISDLDRQIADLNETVAVNGWSSSHSGHKRVQERIQALKDQKVKISQEVQRVQFDTESNVENKARSVLRAKIDEQEIILGQLVRKQRGFEERLVLLDGENQQLQEALAKTKILDRKEEALSAEIGSLRMKRTALELKVRSLLGKEGNPFEILEEPFKPTKPTSPNPWVIAIGSIVFGLAVGFGLALLKEYSKSCFRSARELNRVMTHPVLGTVNAIRTRRERARDFLVRSVLGGGSVLFVLSVGYVTWAWAYDKDSLTGPLVRAIETFQDALK